MFSGSYPPSDVELLLKVVQLAPTPVSEKERLIQSGARHYSEMISAEKLPTAAYLRVFYEAVERQRRRFAHDLCVLAALLAHRGDPLTLISLARAGTPVGVLLTQILRLHHRRDVRHYSISIIRDRGIDEVALRYILERHPAQSLVFIDGWTGKGVIARELHSAVAEFNARHGTALDSGLCVVSDLCGHAKLAATSDDYLIPSCILGATVSGLVSRSILNRDVVGPADFHGCLFYEEWRGADLSKWFVDVIMAEIEPRPVFASVSPEQQQEQRRRNEAFVDALKHRYGIRNENYIKPGIGEATRVLLRRVPERLLLQDGHDVEVAHLRLLAAEKQVPVTIETALPYRAAALIKELD